MQYKKNMVLQGVEEKNKKGLLTISSDGESVKGQLRLYNFGIEPRGIISLGLVTKGKVEKAGLIKSGRMLYTFNGNFTLSDDFSCAVVNFDNGQPKPILYGSTFINERDLVYQEVINALSQTKSAGEVENILDNYGIDFDDDEKVDIEKSIDKAMIEDKSKKEGECQKDCEHCEYKMYYMKNTIDCQNQNVEKRSTKNQSFYSEMKGQIDSIFENNPTEEYLESLIPNSKWVKVELKNGDYYVLGLIYQENELKYICYGVPGVYQTLPPRQLSGYPVWFPLDSNKNGGFGYWLSYQDAENGESVKAVII